MAPSTTTTTSKSSSSSPAGKKDLAQSQQQQQLEEMEAKAVDKAKASADAAFRPAPSVLNAQSAQVLLQQVDGPSLTTYKGTESVYVGRSVPVAAGTTLNVPINISTPGSVVEYAVEIKTHDINFSIVAEREEGITIVKETTRMTSAESPMTQKFLVGTVPCLLKFDFGNEYSWMREKLVSYKITVTPPSVESLAAGRRRRAQACLKAVEDDLQTASSRLDAASQQKSILQQDVAQLVKELEEKKKAFVVAEKEEVWLKERKSLRLEQQKLLKQRLQHGWADEAELNNNNNNNNMNGAGKK